MKLGITLTIDVFCAQIIEVEEIVFQSKMISDQYQATRITNYCTMFMVISRSTYTNFTPNTTSVGVM